MKLRADGTVESLTTRMSTGYAGLDQHVVRTLKAYRFKPKTKGPLLWLVSFAQPATVIVKASRVKEPPDAAPERICRGSAVAALRQIGPAAESINE